MSLADEVFKLLQKRDLEALFSLPESVCAPSDLELFETIRRVDVRRREPHPDYPGDIGIYTYFALIFRQALQDPRAEIIYKICDEMGSVDALVYLIDYELQRGEIDPALGKFQVLLEKGDPDQIRVASNFLFAAKQRDAAHYGYHVAYSRGDQPALVDLMFKLGEHPEDGCPDWNVK